MNTIKVDVTKLNKTHFFHGKNGAIYCDLILFENKNGPGQYGDTHYIVQSVSKEARLKGERGAIVGNAKMEGGAPRTQPQQTQGADQQSGSDSVPF